MCYGRNYFQKLFVFLVFSVLQMANNIVGLVLLHTTPCDSLVTTILLCCSHVIFFLLCYTAKRHYFTIKHHSYSSGSHHHTSERIFTRYRGVFFRIGVQRYLFIVVVAFIIVITRCYLLSHKRLILAGYLVDKHVGNFNTRVQI